MLPFSRSTAHAPTPAPAPRRRCASALAVATALAASAAACSSGGTSTGASASGSVDPYDVAASAQASASATASVSLSPQDAALRETALAMQAPDKPAQMSENSPEGAVAAAEYFISLYPYVYATGDLTEWDAMSEEGCVFCGSVHDNVTELHESGGWADPADIKVVGSNYQDPAAGHEYSSVDVQVETSTSRSHAGDGSISTATPSAYVATMGFALRYSNGHWLIGEGESL